MTATTTSSCRATVGSPPRAPRRACSRASRRARYNRLRAKRSDTSRKARGDVMTPRETSRKGSAPTPMFAWVTIGNSGLIKALIDTGAGENYISFPELPPFLTLDANQPPVEVSLGNHSRCPAHRCKPASTMLHDALGKSMVAQKTLNFSYMKSANDEVFVILGRTGIKALKIDTKYNNTAVHAKTGVQVSMAPPTIMIPVAKRPSLIPFGDLKAKHMLGSLQPKFGDDVCPLTPQVITNRLCILPKRNPFCMSTLTVVHFAETPSIVHFTTRNGKRRRPDSISESRDPRPAGRRLSELSIPYQAPDLSSDKSTLEVIKELQTALAILMFNSYQANPQWRSRAAMLPPMRRSDSPCDDITLKSTSSNMDPEPRAPRARRRSTQSLHQTPKFEKK